MTLDQRQQHCGHAVEELVADSAPEQPLWQCRLCGRTRLVDLAELLSCLVPRPKKEP